MGEREDSEGKRKGDVTEQGTEGPRDGAEIDGVSQEGRKEGSEEGVEEGTMEEQKAEIFGLGQGIPTSSGIISTSSAAVTALASTALRPSPAASLGSLSRPPRLLRAMTSNEDLACHCPS